MYSVSPTNQELFHLRILLNHVKGATSFEDLKRVDGQVEPCQTFTQTCLELGLVKDDKEWEKVLNEVKLELMPYQMRLLFVRLLIHCSPLAPHELWETFTTDLSDDFARNMSEDLAIKKAYREIQRILEIENKTLADFPSMSQNVDFDEDYDIYDPIYDQQIGDQLFEKMNDPQKEVVKKVKDASSGENKQKLFYLDGPDYDIYDPIYDQQIGDQMFEKMNDPQKKVVKKVKHASSGENKQKLFYLDGPETDVFIWDQAPMAPKYALEIMDRLLRDFTKIDEPFGGKILLLGGDFRQLLPVHEAEFAQFLLKIGEAKDNDIYDNIEFPEGFEVETDLVQEVFGHLIEQKRYDDVASSAILSARNADVDELNKQVVDLLPCGGEKRYTSVDTASDGEALQELLTQEYLNSLNPASLPHMNQI
uniref:ATP-dependent DNA helicase n=1 Tax=Panagrolaimus sp. ES5 TaxID=591445 RepID=A0AC34FY32_9BILA